MGTSTYYEILIILVNKITVIRGSRKYSDVLENTVYYVLFTDYYQV